MKRGNLFLLLCMLLQGIQIVFSQECNQKIVLGSALPLHVPNSMLCNSQECILHECGQDQVDDLTWFEWMQKISESLILYIHMSVCKIRLYLFGQTTDKDISLFQEKLAENLAELGYLKKALWYSQESLHSSMRHLAYFEKQVCVMQKIEKITSESVEMLRDQIIHYAQHVQSHIITMTDFASDEKSSDSWQVYEKMLMRYFEKMQQVMQGIDECDELLCSHDAHFCSSAHHDEFDSKMYD